MKMNWDIKKLGTVCTFHNGKAHEKSIAENGKYKVVNSKFVSSNGKKAKRTEKAQFPLFTGDIVMVMSDVPNGKTLAKCFLIDKDDTYTLNQRICAIRTTNFDTTFLYYQLNRNQYLLDFNNGENQTNLRKGDILNCELLVPPLPEQQRIVAILDKAFAAITKAKANAEQNLNNAKELFESYLKNIFENENWKKVKLEDLAKVIGGYSFKSKDFKKEGKYQVIRMGNVRPGIIREKETPVFLDDLEDKVLQRALLLNNDVIITQTGTKKKRDYGFTVVIEKDNYLLNQRISSIRFNNHYLPEFFLYYSWTNFFKDQYFANETGTVGQGNVGIKAILEALIPFPKIEIQQKTINNIKLFSKETKRLEVIYQERIEDLEELKKSVLQKAFAGELKTELKQITEQV